MNELNKILQNLKSSIHIQEALELLYVLKAWEKVSINNKIEMDLTFSSFYNQKVEVKKLATIFEKLSKKFKLFALYRFDNKLFTDDDLTTLLGIVSRMTQLPNVNEVFYNQKGMFEFSVSPQVAQLGAALLDGCGKEVYVPFTNGFAYSYYMNKKIYADFEMPTAEFIAELINILDDKSIEFHTTNALESPTFVNPDAPHLLKQFESVLSFPPFGIKGKIDSMNDKFHRFQFHRGLILDVAHFEHILAQTKEKAVVLMPVGFTYRAGNEEAFRRYLVEQDWLEAIIQLPPNLHSATSIETTFFIVNKTKSLKGKVYFLSLKSEEFIKREGRQIVLTNVDYIVNFIQQKKEIDGVSCIVSNEKVSTNNFSLAIDRYITSQNTLSLNKILQQYELVPLETIAEIRKSQLFKDEGEGKEVYDLSPTDFAKSGFTMECGKTKQLGSQYERYQIYKLQPYDVLLSTKGTIGKVAIVGNIT
nr:N-6 DNA methylase [Campylobacteraceae bacterium]